MKDICNKTLAKHSVIKRVMGKVTSVNSTYTMAYISVVGSNATILLPNKTNQILEVGDFVWVHYWQSLTDGYIAVKNGSGEYRLGVGDDVNNSTISIENAFLLQEGNHEYITTHNYDPNDSYGEVPCFDTQLNAVRTGEYYPDICASLDELYPGRDNSKYCYMYKGTRTLLDGSSISINWIPGIWFNYQPYSSNSFTMFSSVRLSTLISVGDLSEAHRWYLEPRSFYLEEWTDPNTSVRHICFTVSESAHSLMRREILPFSLTDGRDLSDFNLFFSIPKYNAWDYDNPNPYDFPYYLAPSYVPYVGANWLVDTLIVQVVMRDNDVWRTLNETLYGEYIYVPLQTTTISAKTHSGDMVDTKERRVST